MFTFKNPKTPIIKHNTTVEHNGKQFKIASDVFGYFYSVSNSAGENIALVPMTGKGGGYNWAEGVKLVEAAIMEGSKQ